MTRSTPDPEVMAVACPRCGAQPGEHCRTGEGTGSPRINHPHQVRRVVMWRELGDAIRRGKRQYR